MPAPTFVAEYETAWTNNTSPKTTGAFNAQAGDVLVCVGMSEDQAFTLSTPTNTQGGLSWTLRQSVVVSDYSTCYVWTAVVDAPKTGMTVSVARSGNAWHGANVLHFRDSGGVGASAKANATGAPAVNLTTSQPDSAVVVAVADWNATSAGSRTWRTVGSAATEVTYSANTHYTVLIGYHADAGAAGSKTAGLSSPSLKYSIIAVEVLGTAGSTDPGEGSTGVGVTVAVSVAGRTGRAGTATVGATVTVGAAGHTGRAGSALLDLGVALAATGHAGRSGTTSLAASVDVSASGAAARAGAAAVGVAVVAAATGSTSRAGSVTAGTVVQLLASGASSRTGTAAAGVTVGIAAAGHAPTIGVPTGTVQLDLTASTAAAGQTVRAGTAGLGLTVSTAAAGHTPALDVPAGTVHLGIGLAVGVGGATGRAGTTAVDATVAVAVAGHTLPRAGTTAAALAVALAVAGHTPGGDTGGVLTATSYRLWTIRSGRTVYLIRTDRLWEVSSGLLEPPA